MLAPTTLEGDRVSELLRRGVRTPVARAHGLVDTFLCSSA
jgi:hypothetical protein